MIKETLNSLARLRVPVTGPVLPFLQHPVADVRIAAANALGEAGESDASEELTGALGDPDTGVQKAARRALDKLRPGAVSRGTGK